MATSQGGCSICAEDKGTKFCTECGRKTRCPACDTFVDAGCKFCPKCGHSLCKFNNSVNVMGDAGCIATGDHHEGDMTAHIYTSNMKDTKNLQSRKPDVFAKEDVDKSVNVSGSVGLVSTADCHKGDMTSYIHSQSRKNEDFPNITERESLGFQRKKQSNHEMRKSSDDSSDIEFHDHVSDLAKKVGCIWSPVCTGTAFRIGKDLIMTCWHVIKYITDDMRLKHGTTNIYKSKNVWVQFDYKPGQEDYPSEQRFSFHSLNYYNQELDYAIIKLVDQTGNLPPPITRFSRPGVQDTLHLIGHSRSLQKKLDPSCRFDNPTMEDIEQCEEELNKIIGQEWGNYQHDCYQGLKKDERLRFHSGFVQGASGSPGAVRVSGGLSVVTMFARGYPGFYFRLSESEKRKLDVPTGFFIEEGIDIMAILKDISKKRQDIYCSLGVEFCQ